MDRHSAENSAAVSRPGRADASGGQPRRSSADRLPVPSSRPPQASAPSVITASHANRIPRAHHQPFVPDWPSIVPNATCATAIIDRVIHHADVLAIEGESYRLREAETRAGKNAEAPKRT